MTLEEDYLSQLGVTLWPGVSFDITDPKERAKAAAWLEDTMQGLRNVAEWGHAQPGS